ncbi:TMTC3 [Cordylochernes scorpioides]|uniref:TMTC3 n=1 Tax=Cordylochernes scorpioides TaxID=51811 RepID=A0ABY6LN50_9ARAC|nr:TMTC3 [Cordylochernes scorpioides]
MEWGAGLATGAAAAACYLSSLGCGLVFDDIAAVRDNRDVRPHTPLANLFRDDFWGTPLAKEQSHKSYRPLCVLTFRLNYTVHGLDPFGYHLVNVILHTAVCLLYYRQFSITGS